jgi:hypothetical protein
VTGKSKIETARVSVASFSFPLSIISAAQPRLTLRTLPRLRDACQALVLLPA